MGPGIEFQAPGLVASASSHRAISPVPVLMFLTSEIRILHLGIKKTTEDGFSPPGTSDIRLTGQLVSAGWASVILAAVGWTFSDRRSHSRERAQRIKYSSPNDESSSYCGSMATENAIFIHLFTLLFNQKMHAVCHGNACIIYACVTSDMQLTVLKQQTHTKT